MQKENIVLKRTVLNPEARLYSKWDNFKFNSNPPWWKVSENIVSKSSRNNEENKFNPTGKMRHKIPN